MHEISPNVLFTPTRTLDVAVSVLWAPSLGSESHPTQTMGGLVDAVQKDPLANISSSCLFGFKIRSQRRNVPQTKRGNKLSKVNKVFLIWFHSNLFKNAARSVLMPRPQTACLGGGRLNAGNWNEEKCEGVSERDK